MTDSEFIDNLKNKIKNHKFDKKELYKKSYSEYLSGFICSEIHYKPMIDDVFLNINHHKLRNNFLSTVKTINTFNYIGEFIINGINYDLFRYIKDDLTYDAFIDHHIRYKIIYKSDMSEFDYWCSYDKIHFIFDLNGTYPQSDIPNNLKELYKSNYFKSFAP